MSALDTEPRASSEDLATLKRIPSMGGDLIGEYLYRLGREHRGQGDVVEVGSWLGSSCAHVALGLRDAGSKAQIHCFDRFHASDPECVKAANFGVELTPAQDTEPVFHKHVDWIYPRIRSHKIDVRDIAWDGGPIEIYVDDAAKQRRNFVHVMKTFGPSFVPGVTTLVLMDFSMFRRENYAPEKRLRYLAQKNIMRILRRRFKMLYSDWPRTSMACFRYVKPLDFSRFDGIIGPDPLEGRARAAWKRLTYRVTGHA